MPFSLPQFPLAVRIWRATNSVLNPPNVVTVGNLVFPRRAWTVPVVSEIFPTASPPWFFSQVPMSLLLPPLTDIRYASNPGASDADLVEVPSGSQRLYLVLYVDDVGKGFSNEHRQAIIVRATPAWTIAMNYPSPVPLPNWPLP